MKKIAAYNFYRLDDFLATAEAIYKPGTFFIKEGDAFVFGLENFYPLNTSGENLPPGVFPRYDISADILKKSVYLGYFNAEVVGFHHYCERNAVLEINEPVKPHEEVLIVLKKA